MAALTSRGEDRGTLVVAGGARGIGAAVARRAAADGFDVAVNYVSNGAAAEAVVRDVAAAGRRAVALRGDVAVERDVLALFEAAERELGPLRALVTAAGVTGGLARVADLSAEVLARVLAVNVGGTVLCSREAVRRMSRSRGGSGGAVVHVSSLAARLGGGGEWVHYAASKGAVETFTRGLAREVAAEGIRVNAVAPGSSRRISTPRRARPTGRSASPAPSPCSGPAPPPRWARRCRGSSPRLRPTSPAPSST